MDGESIHYYLYGSHAKALVHPEARDGKFELHAQPSIYTGPAHHSHSPVYCSVWAGRYLDVDVGCVNIDERNVVERSSRTHVSNQPYGQPVGTTPAPAIVPSVETWYDPSIDKHPMDVAADEAKEDRTVLENALPTYAGTVWVPGACAPEGEFSVGLCSGEAREADLASWLHKDSSGAHVHVRVDVCIGGYEHRIDRPHVEAGLTALCTHERCIAVCAQLPCGPWSVSKQGTSGGPRPIFDVDHPTE